MISGIFWRVLASILHMSFEMKTTHLPTGTAVARFPATGRAAAIQDFGCGPSTVCAAG